MDNADDLMMASYEDQQSGTNPVDDLDGFEFGSEDEVGDDEEVDEFPFDDDEPMPVWPSDEEKREAELYEPIPLTDAELAQLQSDWDRYGYLTEMLNEHLDRE